MRFLCLQKLCTNWNIVERMSGVKSIIGAQLLENFDSFLFDADGVLWLSGSALPGAQDFVRQLIDKGKKVFIVTNNSTKTIDDYAEKCKKLGFDMVPKDHLVSSAKVCAHMLSKDKSDLPVYLVGSSGLQRELRNAGIESFGVGPDPVENYTSSDFIHDIEVSRPVQAVIVSYDVHISYAKIMKAANYIHQDNVKFIATNEDATFPGPVPGVRIPGSGMNVAAVQCAAEKRPIVIGKPAKPIFEYIKEKFSVDPAKTLMVGDRCDTDIKFGNDNGMTSLLVGTGIHTLEHVKVFEQNGRTDLIPHYYTPSLLELNQSL